MRRVLLLAAAAVLGIGVAALAAGAPGGRAATAAPLKNSMTFTDSSGEDSLAPDVISVTVSNDDQGNVTFAISIPNRPTLTGDMDIEIGIDSDANPQTGDIPGALGLDYIIDLSALGGGPAQVFLARWNGTDFSTAGVPQTSLVFSYASGATIKVSSADLGGTRRFNFLVLAESGIVVTPTGDIDDTNAHFDVAPDPGHGLWSYQVKLTPPALVVRSVRTKPATPRAGKPFTVSVVVARSDNGLLVETGKVTCKATIAGKPVKARSSGVSNGRATCTWLIPATAKGKTIRLSITIAAQGLKATRTVTARIH